MSTLNAVARRERQGPCAAWFEQGAERGWISTFACLLKFFQFLQKNYGLWRISSLKRVAWMVTLKGSLTKQFSPQRHGERGVYSLICFPLRGRKTNNNRPNPAQSFYSKACSCVHSYYLDRYHAIGLFFSGLSTEKKTYFPSAHSASRAKRAVKNILSLTRIAKLGSSRLASSFKGLINVDCVTTSVE